MVQEELRLLLPGWFTSGKVQQDYGSGITCRYWKFFMLEHHLFPPPSPIILKFPLSPFFSQAYWYGCRVCWGRGGAGKQHPLYSEAPFVSLQLFSQPVSYLILLGEKLYQGMYWLVVQARLEAASARTKPGSLFQKSSCTGTNGCPTCTNI